MATKTAAIKPTRVRARMHTEPRFLFLLWAVVLLSPLAWAASLGIMFTYADVVCQRGSLELLVAIGVVCALLAAGAALLARETLARIQAPRDDAEGLKRLPQQRSRFMLELGVGFGVIFALVIVLSIVPIFLLNPCPV